MLKIFLGASFLLGLMQAATSSQPATTVYSNASRDTPGIASLQTPTDPMRRLDLGRRMNGLQGPETGPWHLRASYEVFDVDGKSNDKGTFEEWWVSAKQYKIAYRGREFSQEEYGTDRGVLHSGDQRWPSGPLSQLRRTITEPIPSKEDAQDWGQRNLEKKFGAVRLSCTAFSYHGGKHVDETSPAFCFESTNSVLRYSNSANLTDQAIFDHAAAFRGRLVARDIRVLFLGKPALTVHVEEIEPLDPKDQVSVAVPRDARSVTRRVELSSVVSGVYAIKKVQPAYPEIARRDHVQGMVTLAETIGKDGRVLDTHALAGPQPLQLGAMDAVRQWQYKPYLTDGEAVEVETEVYVIFRIG